MAQWQPYRTPQERNTRAIRSMQNGTLDGRVLASPVRFDPNGYEADENDSDEGIDVGEDAPTLYPFTDTFNPSNSSNLTFSLTYAPWVQAEMPTTTRNRASLHLYWNGVYQRDLSYSLSGKVITIYNDSLQIRSGDVISVKYMYEDNVEPDETTTLYRMECWLDSVSIKGESEYTMWQDRFIGAATSAPPLGQNAGNISVCGTRFQGMEFLGGWESRWRAPKDMIIPTDSSIESMTWMVDFDPGADIRLSRNGVPIENYSFSGNDIGQSVGGQGSCSSAFSLCRDDQPPYMRCTIQDTIDGFPCSLCWQKIWGVLPKALNSQPAQAGLPSPGPTGGKVFSEGDDALLLARLANRYGADGNRFSFRVARRMPLRGDIPSTCASDNTIMGPYNFDIGTYSVRIGVTCVVVRKV